MVTESLCFQCGIENGHYSLFSSFTVLDSAASPATASLTRDICRTYPQKDRRYGRIRTSYSPIAASLSPSSSASPSSSRPVSRRRPPKFVLVDKPSKGTEKISEDSGASTNQDQNDEQTITFDPNHKSGYVALVGKPNVGKSTLMNHIIGQKLSIVTSKPQTTRHRILGICSTDDYQMILYDTPGIIVKRMNRLDEMMMQNIRTAALNADCVLVIIDATEVCKEVIDSLEEGADKIVKNRPSLLVLNKIDLLKPGEISKKKQWYERWSGMDEVLAVSARTGHGVADLKKWLVSRLPLGPPYYPKEHISDQPEKFFASEIIREKIFLQYKKEIPYVSQVNVINYIERTPPAKDFIEAEIIVERDSQKGIMIGKDGAALKMLATAARLDVEDFVGREVYLEIKVKVKEDWRANDHLLKYYGYSAQ